MTATLLTLGEPNLNGRTYTPDVVQEAIEKYLAKGKPIMVLSHFDDRTYMNGATNIENAVGNVENLRVEGNALVGDIRLFPGKEDFQHFSCRPAFIGKVSDDGVVTEAELISFGFTFDPA
jgi:hypothetical protein